MVLSEKGFTPKPKESLKIDSNAILKTKGTLHLKGVRSRQMEMGIEWIKSRFGEVIVLNSPLNSHHIVNEPGNVYGDVERAFSLALAEWNGRDTGIRIIDWAFKADSLGLRPQHFFDRNHLNEQGATLFSEILSDSIKTWVKP